MTAGRASWGFRSPWLDQLDAGLSYPPLAGNAETDVAVVGAGIAGLATAFFVLRTTSNSVLLVERDRAGHGASGRNAGQLVTYFERPLCDLVDAFGFDMATRGQAEVEAAWDLLDIILADSGMEVSVERFWGAMGMFTLNHLRVHLRNNRIRRQAGLDEESILISSDAPFLGEIPEDLSDLYSIVPQTRIRELLEVETDTYYAALLNRKGCGNSALICQELLRHLLRSYPDRFGYAEQTSVDRVTLNEADALLSAGSFTIAARRVVLCTNGFNYHTIDNRAGGPVEQRVESRIRPRVGYMAGFLADAGSPAGATSYIINEEIGGKKPYYYGTRRAYPKDGRPGSLVCLGGPEVVIDRAEADVPDADLPPEIMAELDTVARPLVAPSRPPGLDYDFAWHGLMAYTENKVRLVGVEPRNPVLLYNLGCNGVGFLPSIAGGFRIARLVGDERLEPSIFDPRQVDAES